MTIVGCFYDVHTMANMKHAPHPPWLTIVNDSKAAYALSIMNAWIITYSIHLAPLRFTIVNGDMCDSCFSLSLSRVLSLHAKNDNNQTNFRSSRDDVNINQKQKQFTCTGYRKMLASYCSVGSISAPGPQTESPKRALVKTIVTNFTSTSGILAQGLLKM